MRAGWKDQSNGGSGSQCSGQNIADTLSSRLRRRANENQHKFVNPGRNVSPALSPLPPGKHLPLFHLPWLPQDVRALCDLRPEISAGGRLLLGRDVHQLRPRTCGHRVDRSAVMGGHGVVGHQGYDLGGCDYSCRSRRPSRSLPGYSGFIWIRLSIPNRQA